MDKFDFFQSSFILTEKEKEKKLKQSTPSENTSHFTIITTEHTK